MQLTNPAYNYTPIPIQMGGVLMSDLAKVWNRPKKGWRVTLSWQGKRYEFATYLGTPIAKFEPLAKRLADAINTDVDKGIFNPARYKTSKPLHLKNFSNRWLKSVKPSISYPTYKDYKNSLNNHIIPVLGDEYLSEINYEKLIDLFNAIDRNIKGKKNVFGCLHKLMVDARKSGYIAQVPEWIEFKGASAIPQKAIEWIDRETQLKILKHIPKDDQYIFRFLMATGIRPSEARAFRKQDIKKDHIIIEVTFAPVPGGEELTIVKQKRARRIEMYESLKQLFRETPKNLTPYVFINPRTGKHYSKNTNRDIWNPACKKAKINISLNNACRHSFGNQMAEGGVDIKTVSELMGHSNTAITKKHYATSSRKVLKTVVDNVQKLQNATQMRPNEKGNI